MATKKKKNWLRIIRITLASLLFAMITLYLVDFTNLLPKSWKILVEFQFIPAILAAFSIGWIVILLLTLVFGRIYCSVLCPAGIFQDLIVRLSRIRWVKKKGKKKKFFFEYKKPFNILRYSILGLSVVLWLLGSIHLLLLLDPYSNFGRMMSSIFRPSLMWTNNMAAEGLMKAGKFWLFHVDINTVSIAALVAAFLAMGVFIVMSVLHGRLFCNTLCPVGSTLSLLSKFSLFRIRIDHALCNSCGNCTRACKAECIDFDKMTVDNSRCVTCFNCISHCHRGGLHYQFVNPFKKTEAAPLTETAKFNAKGRRIFFGTMATVLATAPLLPAFAQKRLRQRRGLEGGEAGEKLISIKGEGGPSEKHHKQNKPITPPGSGSLDRFLAKCTACHLCVVKCPTQILKPVGFEYGMDYLLKPEMWYTKAYCNYDCTVCSDVCPSDALKPLTLDEKQVTQVGLVQFVEDLCIVKTDETDCGACAEHCPTRAVKMVPYKGSLTIPKITEDICIGCGGCEYICPVRPKRAIFIVANPVHKKVKKPEEGPEKKVESLDFGF
jgi:ferredoxin